MVQTDIVETVRKICWFIIGKRKRRVNARAT